MKKFIIFVFVFLSLFAYAINVEAYGYYNDTMEYSEFFPVISEAVGWWRLDNSTVDDSDYNHHGTKHGTVNCNTDIEGNVNTSCFFADGDNRIVVTPTSYLEVSQNITVMAWINVSSNTGSIFNYAKTISSKKNGFALDIMSNPRFYIGDGDGTWEVATGTSSIPTNKPVFIAGTYDGSVITVYVDGKADGTHSFSGLIYYDGFTSEQLCIGTDSNGAQDLEGIVDDVIIFNKTLSINEIGQYFNCTDQNPLTLCNSTATPDIIAPNYETFANLTNVAFDEDFAYDINTTEDDATLTWAINSTDFNISSIGEIQNDSALEASTGYYFEINATDGSGNTNTTWFEFITESAVYGADSNLTYINITSNTCTTSSPFALNATLRCQPGGGENCSGLWNISAMSSGCSLYNGTNKGSFNFNSTTGDFSFLTYYACSVSADHLFWLNASNSDNYLNLSNYNVSCSTSGGGLTPAQQAQLDYIEANLLTEDDTMNIYAIMFLIHFLAVISITGLKTYNITKKGEFYDMTWSWLLFGGFFIAWFIGLITILTNPEMIFYVTFFKFSTALMLLNVVFLVIELLLYWKTIGVQQTQPYFANQQ